MSIRSRRDRKRAKIKEYRSQQEEMMNSALDEIRSMRSDLDNLGPSEAASIQAQDPRLVEAQMRALQQLQDVGEQGWTQQDAQALGMAQRQAALGEQAQRQAMFQQAQARGMGGSGAMIAGGLAAQQGAANRGADAATQMGMAGRDRALAAIQQGAAMAGGMDAQRFGQGMARGGAMDAFNQWATGARMQGSQALAGQMGTQAGYAGGRADALRAQMQSGWNQAMGLISTGVNAVGSFYGGGGGGS
jgi:hypothetical protein